MYTVSSPIYFSTHTMSFNGMWQVAGGHGHIDHKLAMEDMIRYHDAGFTSWDLADIYGPAEDFIGECYLSKLFRALSINNQCQNIC